MAALNRAVWCPSARLVEGWAEGVLLQLDDTGAIEAVATGVERAAASDAWCMPGATVAGMPNLHSHAFQRAIAGLTQLCGPGDDSFWTWREAMYASLDGIGPDAVQAIAAALYVELLEGGFTSVAEFHYVHHAPGGARYDDPAELSWRIVAAAEAAGIGLVHLPVLYQTGGFDGRPLSARQARFGWTVDGVLGLVDRVGTRLAADPDRTVGLALHSLRAVPPDALIDVVDGLDRLRAGAPIHIHIAEQTAEVEACLAARGTRPVAWLCDHAPVDPRWCLVHATHVDPSELAHMRSAGVVAGLCPTTEADLGDGLFPAVDWVRAGGLLGVGTDSHVGRSAADELRWLEYGQRLVTRGRNVLQWPTSRHTGDAAWGAAVAGGRRALGRRGQGIEVGARADLVSVDPHAPGLTGLQGAAVIDAWVFGGASAVVDTVMVGGRVRVVGGRHVARGPVMDRFAGVLAGLRASL